ncbi:DNA/RNA non-specific endonuclease [Actinomadura litoris]|uniref:Serine protease n=1 Tax=Actinomadura litoris TaxID=2678616 RepID=A0A7K1LE59_9ACTN|nr:DNA/RNA non-specific endonuclease [Actinomadura litoris]MUN42720.1 endonuclease [Actinomadura litoris]
MKFYESGREQQRDAAARRVSERAPARRGHEAALASPGGIASADSPERIAKRVGRLGRFYREGDAPDPAAHLEKIINTVDYLGVRYLDAGVAAARAVARVDIRDERGTPAGYGTGSLVSPALLLTNHHVLPDAGTARTSVAEFDYQDGIDGRPLPSVVHRLDPDRFFLADPELDFALVAVRASPAELAVFGHNPLIEAEGKAIIGEFVTIVQHPRGGRKQVALRENRIVDVADRFLHYATDTEPGSSGSPVFNDQWEVVALHHAGVPAPEQDELGGFVNEGVRVSRVCHALREAELPEEQRALVDQLFAAAPDAPPALLAPAAAAPAPVLLAASAASSASASAAPAQAPAPVRAAPEVSFAAVPASVLDRAVTVSVPLEVTVRLADGHAPDGGPPGGGPPESREATAIDPDYASRGGYDPAFLARPLPLPALPPELAADASAELRYHHFSVVMHRRRRLALFTACNIDGKQAQRPKRRDDRWILDPRLPVDEQTGERVYADNDLDRGHLVRRLDPAWGAGEAEVKAAVDDTFHFTNSTPQHHAFNAGGTLWLGLEDYVLDNADNLDLAVSVFAGPVLAADDDAYRGVRLPRQFWKIVAMVGESGALSVTGYLLSQAALIADLPTEEAFSYGAYRTFQLPVRRIAELTGLGLDPFVKADPLERTEATAVPREIVRPDDLVL